MSDIILSDEQAYHRLADTYQNALIELQKQFAAQAAELAFVKAERDALRVAVIDMHNRYHEGWNVDIGDCGYEDCQKLASALAAKG